MCVSVYVCGWMGGDAKVRASVSVFVCTVYARWMLASEMCKSCRKGGWPLTVLVHRMYKNRCTTNHFLSSH